MSSKHLNHRPGATYQTATTRAYYHGRTETVRSCTPELIEWCKQMSIENKSNRLSDKELLDLLLKACKKHNQLMNEARQNAGVDRHLMGLRLVARDLDMKVPDLYTDPAWKKCGGDGNFVISSSCLGSSNAVGTCAAMCLDGYTMIYSFPDNQYVFRFELLEEINPDIPNGRYSDHTFDFLNIMKDETLIFT